MWNLNDMDSTVTPKHMQKRFSSASGPDPMRGLVLRVGYVTAVYKPTDPENLSQKFFEYDVSVEDGTPFTGLGRFPILRCKVGSMFGGVADYTKWTVRINPDPQVNGNGTQVVVQCINGNLYGGLIVGGHQHTASDPDDPSLGHHYSFRFNGISQTVNDDGEFTVSYTGASDLDGNTLESVDPGSVGSYMSLTKDGSIISEAKKQWKTTGHTASLTANGGDITLHASGKVKTTSAGVELGKATDAMLLGSTYRQAQAELNTSLQTALAGLSSSLSEIAIALLGLGIPLPGTSTAIPLLTNAVSAITTFEAAALTYLSLTNKLD